MRLQLVRHTCCTGTNARVITPHHVLVLVLVRLGFGSRGSKPAICSKGLASSAGWKVSIAGQLRDPGELVRLGVGDLMYQDPRQCCTADYIHCSPLTVSTCVQVPAERPDFAVIIAALRGMLERLERARMQSGPRR